MYIHDDRQEKPRCQQFVCSIFIWSLYIVVAESIFVSEKSISEVNVCQVVA